MSEPLHPREQGVIVRNTRPEDVPKVVSLNQWYQGCDQSIYCTEFVMPGMETLVMEIRKIKK